MSGEVPDSPESRRQFAPDDPTERTDFNPANWTGTVLSGLISTRTECGGCGQGWHDGPCDASAPRQRTYMRMNSAKSSYVFRQSRTVDGVEVHTVGCAKDGAIVHSYPEGESPCEVCGNLFDQPWTVAP